LEKAFRAAGPQNAGEAFNVIKQATTEVGMDVGVGAMAAGGSIVLQNVGGVATTITSTGQVIVQRGSEVILHLMP
jgi:hypothetical protein